MDSFHFRNFCNLYLAFCWCNDKSPYEANHPAFEWFTCLAYGIIASLVARTLIIPSGLMAEVPLWQRLIPMCFAFVGFYMFGKRLLVGIVFGETVFIFLLLVGWVNF